MVGYPLNDTTGDQQRVGEDVPLMPNQRGKVSATGPALQ